MLRTQAKARTHFVKQSTRGGMTDERVPDLDPAPMYGPRLYRGNHHLYELGGATYTGGKKRCRNTVLPNRWPRGRGVGVEGERAQSQRARRARRSLCAKRTPCATVL